MPQSLASALSTADLRGTKVVFRSGSPLDKRDLIRSACAEARSIVVMATDFDDEKADAKTMRVLLSLKGNG